jgi:hypothetical protein
MKFKTLLGFAVVIFGSALAMASPNFTRESGIRLSSGMPYTVVDASSGTYRLYFTTDTFRILSATSTDGLTWSQENGVRLDTTTIPLVSTIPFVFTGAAVLPLTGGGFRMVYSVMITTSDWRIVTATSSNGLAWANEPTPIFTSTGGFIGGPQLIKRSNGDWQLYFLHDSNGGDDLTDRVVYTSVSSNQGVAWTTQALAFSNYASAISAVVRNDRRVRLYLTRPVGQETTSSVVASALSTDVQGTSFNFEAGTRFSTDSSTGNLSSLAVFRATDTVEWRMLYAFQAIASTSSCVLSAITLDPDPQFVSPTQVIRSAPASTLTITGEVFESTPSVSLVRSGETDIPGTSVVRNSDMSLTATFDTTNKTIGAWNVAVTNPNGHAATLANALLITFQTGDITLTDNLLRPKTGARTKIDINIFEDGDVVVAVYTLDGRLVNSLYHAPTSVGLLTLYWDGKTGEGNLVASGVYFIKVDGPKLKSKQKVVVIR